MATVTGAPAAAPKLGGRLAWTALILVALTQAMSMVDRQILAILAPRIKEHLQVGDAELGMLYGTVFAVFYALFSLPLGRLADGWIRTRLLSVAITGWSLMTALAGFAQNFATLAATRLGVGIGEASVIPAGMSLLSDMFPREKRGMISAMIAAAIALGLGGAIWLGGAVADAWDAAWPAGGAPLGLVGWQAAFVVAATPGFLLGLALLFLPEPQRGVADGIPPPEDPHVFRESGSVLMQILPGLAWIYLARRRAPARTWAINILGLVAVIVLGVLLTGWTNGLRPTNAVALRVGALELSGNALQWTISCAGLYILLCWSQALRLRDRPSFEIFFKTPALNAIVAIAVLQTVINYALMGWTPTYLVRHFDQSLGEVGAIFGPISAAVGILGPLIAGPVSDFFRKLHPSGRLFVLLGSMVLSPLAAILVYNSQSLTGFYLLFVLLSILTTLWLPPVYASVLDLVLPRMRGTMMSYYTLITTILGLGLGPYAVGLISDITGDIGGAILAMYWVSPVIVLLTLFAIRRLPGDEAAVLDRARAAGEPV